MHDRLREALDLTRAALDGGAREATRDLLLFCRGFCAALAGHHEGEDRTLFPAVAAAIMESHFRYEERQLLSVLETLRLDADPAEVLGPL